MKVVPSLFFSLIFSSQMAQAALAPAEANFSAYTSGYTQPEFFDSNDEAFSARLKLLDMAPRGAHVRIATFVFDNGQSTRRLARHICLASGRGLRVELLIDSKSGDRPGQDDAFDKSENKQVVEELVQYMANCGASVFIHNPLESYVEVFGFRTPNFFNDPEMERRKLGIGQIVMVIKRVSYLISHATELVEEEFQHSGINASPRGLLKNLKSLALGALTLMGNSGNATFASGEDAKITAPPSLRSSYDGLINDSIWDEVNSSQLAKILPRMEARFRADKEFGSLSENFRRFNRLNHRKLFLVESAGASCMILGGRNLGDQYLVDSEHSFFDGDLLLCGHHGRGASEAIGAAGESFENLKGDREDPFLHSNHESQARLIPANKQFLYRSLLFPEGLAPKGAEQARYSGKLKAEERSLLPERRWTNAAPLHGSLQLKPSSWGFLRSGWDPAQDEVRTALLERIKRETKEIFIETAYAEFDAGIRQALEGALARGVKVELITNSFLTLDGGSKLIRIMMFTWMEKMQERYPRAFEAHYTAFSGGHMTHIKMAAFGCQDGERAYILGSHNFHPRSGQADKEHALTWQEEGGCETALASVSLVQARHRFYNDFFRKSHKRVLDQYPDLLKELKIAASLYRPGEESSQQMARSLMDMFYDFKADGAPEFRNAARVHKVFRLIDESGLHDLMARIL